MKQIYKKVWQKNYLRIIAFSWLFGTSFIFISDHLPFTGNIAPVDKISHFIYFSTLMVVLWYSREAYDLKRINNKILIETRRQIDFEKRPYLKLEWRGNEIKIINIGRGAARNIELNFVPEKNNEYLEEIKKIGCLKIPIISQNGGSTCLNLYNLVSTYTINIDNELIVMLHPKSRSDYRAVASYSEIDEEKKHKAIFKPNWKYDGGYYIDFQE